VSVVADIVELILADHARIRRLFAVLDDAVRSAGQPGACEMLSQAWARLEGLIELHAAAEEEICYLALFGHGTGAMAELQSAIADHDDIREGAREAALHEVGSGAWWRAVTAVKRASTEHMASEEQGVLADFRRRARPTLRDDLARRWVAFILARTRDAALPGAGPGSAVAWAATPGSTGRGASRETSGRDARKPRMHSRSSDGSG